MKLTTLATRRLCGGIIYVFKMLKEMVDVDSSQYITNSNNNLRGHSHKLFKPRFRRDCGKFFFGNRIVDECNLIPEDVVSSTRLQDYNY